MNCFLTLLKILQGGEKNMKVKTLLIKAVTLIALLIVLLISSSAIASQKEHIITMTIEKLNFDYSKELYWDEEQFNQEYEKYCKNEAEYLKNFVESFSSKFLKSNLKATDWNISFKSQYELETKELTYSSLVHCEIEGAATGTPESPYFRTEWLLIPILGNKIDLLDFNYATDKMLIYKGEINHIPTTIIIKSSKPISHCHYHIWYK